MRWQRPLLIVAAVLVAIAVVVIGGLFAFRDLSADAVRRVVVPRLEAITRRDVSITGDFDLVPSLTPTLAAEGLVVANAPWGSRPTMLQAERVEVELQLLPLLLKRDVLIDRLALVGADILLERGPGGQTNWEFDPAAPEQAQRQRELLLNEVSIEDSRVTWHDAASGRSETVTVEQLIWQADSATVDLVLSGAGEFHDHPFTLAGELGSIARLRGSEEPYPIALELTIEDLEVVLEGQLSSEGEAQLEVRMAGESLARVADLVGRPLPDLGAFELQGKMTGPLDELALTELSGRIGDETGLVIEVTDGRIGNILDGEGIQLAVRVAGPSLAALGDLVGRELPELGAYEVRGELTGSIDDLALVDLSGTIGADAVANIRITDGRIEDVLAGEGIRVQLVAAGQELARLAAALGVEMAPFGPYQFEGTLAGSFDRLMLQNASATAGDEAAQIELAGAIDNMLALSGLDLAVTSEGQNVAALAPLTRVDLPTTDRYRIVGHLWGSANDLRVDDLEIELADSTLGGWLAVHRPEAGTPRIEGEIVADRLDLDRILALADRTHEEPEAEQALTEEPAPGEGRVFPIAPLPLEALDRIQADLVLRADEVILDATELTNASLDLTLLDGRLSLDDLVVQVGGGRVVGDVAVDAEAGAAEVMVRLSAGKIDVGRLLSDFGATEQVVGEVDIDVNIDSTGRSIDELMAQLEGSAAVAAEEGRIEDNQLHRLVADLDILRALPPFWRREKAVRVNCLIGEFDIEDGVAVTGAMLDTQRMTLLGEGTVDLGEETFDLLLRPLPKPQKLSTLAVPVEIEGTFAEPAVKPRTGSAAAQAVRGLLGGLLVPLNQISALFGQETVDACADALRQAQERRQEQATEIQSPT
jgi:uncharacterized protein involved in outer membrane biogenesis